MRTDAHSIVFSRQAVQTYLAGLTLLAVSAYGFGRGIGEFASSAVGLEVEPVLFIVFLGVLPLILFLCIALRKGIELGRILSSAEFKFRMDELQKRMNDQEDFLHAINSNLPGTLTIYNSKNEYWFVNSAAAKELGISDAEALGRKPVEVLGAERGRKILHYLEQVRQSAEPVEVLEQKSDIQGGVNYIQTCYYAMKTVGGFANGVLARGENVTHLIIERERRENMLRQIISTLVAVVDRRDPYAAGHSAHVGELARGIALEMKLSVRDVEAAEVAGSLMNFGKVLISRSVLTKTGALTPEELQRIRDGILTSADILSIIDFNSPVVPTLRQVLERYDGSGVPQGLQGEGILVAARIVAVANAFVALVSPRAYRPGVDFHAAEQRLAEDAGKAFDPAVLVALQQFLAKNVSKFAWIAAKI